MSQSMNFIIPSEEIIMLGKNMTFVWESTSMFRKIILLVLCKCGEIFISMLDKVNHLITWNIPLMEHVGNVMLHDYTNVYQ